MAAHSDFIAHELGKIEETLARKDCGRAQRLADHAENLALTLGDAERRAALGLGADAVGCRSAHGQDAYERALRVEAALRARGPRTIGELIAATATRPEAAQLLCRYRAHFAALAAERPVVQNVPLSFILALIVARLAPARIASP